jgi:hypothetical protein
VKILASAVACMLFCVPGVPQTALVNAASRASLPSVELTATRGPREIEDLTRQKILHDYAAAWKTLAAGFEQNRADLLNDYFTGFAKDEFSRAIKQQAATGIHRLYVDRGHKLEAIFYSPDGGLMQLRDNAEYEIQIFDGAKLLHSETVSVRFLVLMTPAADRWMVRLLQDVPTS